MRSVGGIIKMRVNQSSFTRHKHRLFGGVVYFVRLVIPHDVPCEVFPVKQALHPVMQVLPYNASDDGSLVVQELPPVRQVLPDAVPEEASPVKVGYFQRPRARLSTIQSHSPYPVELIGALLVPEGEECKEFEGKVKLCLAGEKRMNGEWFDIPVERIREFLTQIADHFGTEEISPEAIMEGWL